MARPHFAVVWQDVDYTTATVAAKHRCGHSHATEPEARQCAVALAAHLAARGVRCITGILRVVAISRTGRMELVGTVPAPWHVATMVPPPPHPVAS